jgi:transposase
MSNITTIGIDIAKNVFQIEGTDMHGNSLLTKRVKRDTLLRTLANLPMSTIGMEACGSSHYWAREIWQLGHEVKLMSPQYVKPFVKANKNDKNDAKGIAEAVSRKSMRFVAIRSMEQQQIATLHRMREQLIAMKTQLSNHIRSLLAEYGIVASVGTCALRHLLQEIEEGRHDEALGSSAKLFKLLSQELKGYEERKRFYDNEIKANLSQNEMGELLLSVPGVGSIIASALLYKITDINDFKHGYDLSAWFGLVPRQSSSGQKQRLYNISKRGDRYIRALLIHGARSVIRAVVSQNKQASAYDQWIQHQLSSGKHVNKVVVALANKNLRIIWGVLKNKQAFDPDYAKYYQGSA